MAVLYVSPRMMTKLSRPPVYPMTLTPFLTRHVLCSNISGAMRDLQITHAFYTSFVLFAFHLEAFDLATLKTLIIGAGSPPQESLTRCASVPDLQVYSAYRLHKDGAKLLQVCHCFTCIAGVGLKMLESVVAGIMQDRERKVGGTGGMIW